MSAMAAALFLNIDLDLHCGDAVARVLDAIGEGVVVLNQTPTLASIEVLEQPATIDDPSKDSRLSSRRSEMTGARRGTRASARC